MLHLIWTVCVNNITYCLSDVLEIVMPTPKQIRDRLIQEQYQKFVVADIGNFP